ncbi:MAG: glucose-1-phosphate cytidylyltransferase [Phycisphaerae bacterium]|nr:glucose-1-phosphate cytidylyltransferase [Phycisphaerae bacterium]
MVEPANVPVFVLCGGLGTRFREETEFRPKPMIAIGSRPILWHIMRRYARFGFRHFVLCLGYKGEAIKSYFLNYATLNSDFTVELMTNRLEVHSIEHDQDWKVTLADTGERTMTGGRIARAATAHLGEAEHFAVTYGDGLCDVDLAEELAFHCGHGRVGTVLGANPPSRFGELELDGDRVMQFSEKPDFEDSWINGGYFFFRRDFLSYLDPDEGCVLEQKPLVKLAEDDQLSMFRHRHFWQCMDTQRDWDLLNRLWDAGDAPWTQ